MKTAELVIKGWFPTISPLNRLDGDTYAQGYVSPFYIFSTECQSACFICDLLEQAYTSKVAERISFSSSDRDSNSRRGRDASLQLTVQS
jgi:hypothetical protein